MMESNIFQPKTTLNLKGKPFDISSPKVMGIINATPDSFYNVSRAKNVDTALAKTEIHLRNGASFIDIGAYSTRPGGEEISLDEELKRLCPVVESISEKFPEAIISIDSFRAKVAEEGIAAGAHIINDISAGDLDPLMFETVAKLNVPYIIMHMQGTPTNMQINPNYEDVTLEVIQYLSTKVEQLKNLHVHDVIIDPGFGFGKTLEHNFKLLKDLNDFKIFNLPILAGISRKGLIYKTLESSATEALNGTSILNTIALQNGASILRVHDVKEAMECIKLVDAVSRA